MEKNIDSYERMLAIRQILKEWDPIGVSSFDGAEDEYDGYIPDVDALITHKASIKEIFDYLWKIETEYMGLLGNRAATGVISERLFALGEHR